MDRHWRSDHLGHTSNNMAWRCMGTVGRGNVSFAQWLCLCPFCPHLQQVLLKPLELNLPEVLDFFTWLHLALKLHQGLSAVLSVSGVQRKNSYFSATLAYNSACLLLSVRLLYATGWGLGNNGRVRGRGKQWLWWGVEDTLVVTSCTAITSQCKFLHLHSWGRMGVMLEDTWCPWGSWMTWEHLLYTSLWTWSNETDAKYQTMDF